MYVVRRQNDSKFLITMHIVLGGTGNVGSTVAEALLARGEPVTIITRHPAKVPSHSGAQIAVIDVHDVEGLRRVFRQGSRLFLLNPPAPPSTDTAAEERRSLSSILTALKDSGLQKIVAESTYGAQPGERLGDSGVLYEMEEALAAQPIPATIIRAAYYMSNWDASLKMAREQGTVQTFYPADFALPMVAPRDIGQVAARLLMEPIEHRKLHFVEGPRRYTSRDVAAAFATKVNRMIEVAVVPRDRWVETLKGMGFSDRAAESFANMTAATLDGPFPEESLPIRGTTSLTDYLEGVAHPLRTK
jgi:uncharacterized protein YbjT (DUF2867 family)